MSVSCLEGCEGSLDAVVAVAPVHAKSEAGDLHGRLRKREGICYLEDWHFCFRRFCVRSIEFW